MQHLVGICLGLKRNLMASHNKICNLLSLEGKRMGWTVLQAPRLHTATGRLGVPAIVMVKGERGLILDVAISFETTLEELGRVAAAKVAKYTPFIGAIRGLFPEVRTVTVLGFPMGARGKWFKGATRVLELVGASKTWQNYFARLVSRRTLLATVDLCRAFRAAVRQGGLAATYTTRV